MTEYIKKSDVLELMKLPKELVAEYVYELKGVWLDVAEQTEPISHDDYVETENDHLEARCLNCNNAKACKEKHWEGCVYEPKYEKTCETCKYWKYIAHEWQCETTKCQGYTPKTEPNCSEIPNNCEPSKIIEAYSRGYTDGADAVKAVKDEPSTECKRCKHFKYRTNCGWECEYDTFEECHYKPKDEPQSGKE